MRTSLCNFSRERHVDAVREPFAEIEFSIPSMACDGCAERIAVALRAIPGVRAVKAKLWRKRVRVRFEPSRVSATQLKDALRAAGFSPVDA